MVAKRRVLFIVLSFVLLFGFQLPVHAEENATGAGVNYTIYVNRTKNCITVMQQQPDGSSAVARVMVCSCGREGHRTPEGTFRTSAYYDWRLMVDGSYARYAVKFSNNILLHSVTYVQMSPDTLKWDQYNILGNNASLGCVRLTVEDAKWIYDNCAPGTQVIVYSGEEIVGGVTRPDTLRIPEDSPYRGWDPTDPTPGNPWLTSDNETLSRQRALEAFDYIAYADRYEDVREVFGYDKTALYDHYITYGISENRIAEFAQSIDNFDYIAYADRYEDVRDAFGYDQAALYAHYITYGVNEGRIAEFN